MCSNVKRLHQGLFTGMDALEMGEYVNYGCSFENYSFLNRLRTMKKIDNPPFGAPSQKRFP